MNTNQYCCFLIKSYKLEKNYAIGTEIIRRGERIEFTFDSIFDGLEKGRRFRYLYVGI